jgi:hypothetical protein
METRRLKNLVEAGHYKPEPALVADAMLRRRGVRALLGDGDVSPAGRIPPASASRRRAA